VDFSVPCGLSLVFSTYGTTDAISAALTTDLPPWRDM
jgi:hypothetical protein